MEIRYNVLDELGNIQEEIFDVVIDDTSSRVREIKGIHNLTITYSLPKHKEIPVGATCVFEGETYTLENPNNFTMVSSRHFNYTLIMESSQAKLKNFIYRNIADNKLKFELMAKPKQHLQMLVDNLNERDNLNECDSGWSVGACLESENKLIAYNHTNCMDALGQMADTFETEWEIIGKVISLCKVEYRVENPLALSYGRGNGFKSGLGRNNYNSSPPIEKLFVQGGDRNIDFSTYENKDLLLPKKLKFRFDGNYFGAEDVSIEEDEAGITTVTTDEDFTEANARSYKTDALGYSVECAVLKTKNEGGLDCSHIYPNYEHTVTNVVSVPYDLNDLIQGSKCDIFDENSPVDYAPANSDDIRMGSETATIIFQSGMLAGREFEIKSTEDELTGYVHTDEDGVKIGKFELKSQDFNGFSMPSETYKPIIGDKFRVFGVDLPNEYILQAEKNMLREATKHLYENEKQRFTFSGEVDGIWVKRDHINIAGAIKLGSFIRFRDTIFCPDGQDIRITRISENINDPHSPTLTLSNSTKGVSYVSDIERIKTNEVVVEENHKKAQQFAKRRFSTAKESIKMLENLQLDFEESIKPISVNTMKLLVGDESLQFEFTDKLYVEGEAEPNVLNYDVTYKHDTAHNQNSLKAPSGFLRHLTLGIETVSPTHGAGEYKEWIVAPLTVKESSLEIKKGYYLYIKASKTTQDAEFYVSELAYKMDSPDGYYFIYGSLSSNVENSRSIDILYGFTEISPGGIRTKKIVSNDGNTYFDLANGEIGGKITFLSGSGGLSNVEGWNESQKAIESAQNTATSANNSIASAILDYNAKFDLQQGQIDGSITTWFLDPIPTLLNAPADEWNTTEKKNIHLGDLYYDASGKAYRFELKDSLYKWIVITDTDVTKALADAKKAQDTANSKHRVFSITPYTPYEIGDLWVDGEVLRKCNNIRLCGDSISTDWGLAVKYDNTQTVIDGGVVTSGTIRLAGDDKNIKAGITGKGIDADSVRMWAGATEENKENAPFRVLNNGTAVMGDITADTDGVITIGDNNEIILTRKTISPESVITGEGYEGSMKIEGAIFTDRFDGELSGVLTVKKNNSSLYINTVITAQAVFRGGEPNTDETGNVWNWTELFLKHYSINGAYISSKLIGRVEAEALYSGGDYAAKVIEWEGTVNEGRYRLSLKTGHHYFPTIDDWILTSTIRNGVMSYIYTGGILRTEIGSNGMSLAINSHNYEHTSGDSEGNLTKVFKGKFDVPGVLASYEVDRNGNTLKRFGERAHPSKNATRVAQGHYSVPHLIGHSDYNILATAYSSSGLLVATIVSKGNLSADIWIRGENNSWWDHGFDITFFGSNK